MTWRHRLFMVMALALLPGCDRGAEPAPLPTLGDVPAFSLIDERGEPISRDALQGKIWVADFIFTHCAGPCPIMSRRMAGIQTWLRGTEGVRLVSFSVDPERDRPEVLREYAKRYSADPKLWTFVTGGKKAIFDLAIHGFKLTVSDATAIDPILHSTYFMLVDRQGRIRGAFNGEDETFSEKLTDAIRRLLREEPA